MAFSIGRGVCWVGLHLVVLEWIGLDWFGFGFVVLYCRAQWYQLIYFVVYCAVGVTVHIIL